MSTIAILGSGRVGMALADKLGRAGHEVFVGTRDPGRAAAERAGSAARFADHATAAGRAGIVVNASPGESTVERLTALRGALEGKILVDVSNATRRDEGGMPTGLVYPDGSVAERLQEALPGTRVVKTLNTMLFSVMADPRSLRIPPTAFLSGDDADAKTAVRALLADLGWPDDWIEDLGGIATARGTEAFVLLGPHLVRGRELVPFALTVAR